MSSEERATSTAADCSAATDGADATEPRVQPTTGVSHLVSADCCDFDRCVLIDWGVPTDRFVVDMFSDVTKWMYARYSRPSG